MNKNNILYTTDQNYFPHMLTSIYSLIENNLENTFKIHIIHTGLKTKEDKLLNQILTRYPNVDIQTYDFMKIAYLIEKFNIPKWRDGNISNARLFYHEMIPHVEKILYLDCDTIIVNPINELFQMNNDHAVSAVKEIVTPKHLKGKVNKYYNSGVLLFNSEKWESDDCLAEMYDNIKNLHEKLIYPDQDLINLTLKEKIGTLPINYNILPLIALTRKYPHLSKKFYEKKDFFYEYKEAMLALKNPKIYHHISYLSTRVWEENKIHPFNDEYKFYRKKWDNSFIKKKNSFFLANLPIASVLSLAVKSYLSDETHDKIRKIIKK